MANRCDPAVFERGEVVFITHTIPSAEIESWVQAVARRSGQTVDWHFVGGRAVLRCLGDLNEVRAAILGLRGQHDDAMRRMLAELRLEMEDDRSIQGVWEYNAYLLVGAKEELQADGVRRWLEALKERNEARAERDELRKKARFLEHLIRCANWRDMPDVEAEQIRDAANALAPLLEDG